LCRGAFAAPPEIHTMIEFTQPYPGSVAPVRSGWYPASTEDDFTKQRYYDGASWSAPVDEAGSRAEFDAARAIRMSPDRVAALRWRGLTRRSARWLAAELAR